MAIDKFIVNRQGWSDYIFERYGIRYKPATFGKMATLGGGPQYVRIGRDVASRPAWLDEWIAEKISTPRRSTSEAA